MRFSDGTGISNGLALGGFTEPVPLGLQCAAQSPFGASVSRWEVAAISRASRVWHRSRSSLRRIRKRLAAAGADLDGLEIPLLSHHHVPLPRQFQAGNERAGPGRAPPQRTPGLGLGGFRRRRQQAVEWRAVRHGREQTQDALTRRRDVMEIGQRWAIHTRGVGGRIVVEQRQTGPEKFDDVDLVRACERGPEQLRLPPGRTRRARDVAVAPASRPAPASPRRPPRRLRSRSASSVAARCAGASAGSSSSERSSSSQDAITTQSPCWPSGFSRPGVPHGRDELVDQSSERNSCQVDLLRPRQDEQTLQRTAVTVERQKRRPPSPAPSASVVAGSTRGVPWPGAVSRPDAAVSTNRNAGQRARKLAIAARGVSPSVKKP